MDTLVQDLRTAIRQLIRGRGTSVLAIGTLAIGIGASTAAFTWVNAALFRPAPAADPAQLAWLQTNTAQRSGRNLSYPEYREFRNRVSAFSGLVASENLGIALGGDSSERVGAQIVSGNFFQTLGIDLAFGRAFTLDDERPGSPSTIVLSYGLWQRRFGHDPAVLGKTVPINGHPFTVVGVAQRGFSGLEFGGNYQAWVPLGTIAEAWPIERDRLGRNVTWLHVVARLKPGVTLQQATDAASAVARGLSVPGAAQGFAPSASLTGVTLEQVAGGLRPNLVQRSLPTFILLAAIPLLVLAVACANVANLLLARSLGRQREMAVRRAIGASRARVVRQVLTEAVVLALLAGGLGVVLSFWITDIITSAGGLPGGISGSVGIDARVLGFATGTAMLTGILFGLAPALSVTGVALIPALKDETGTSLGVRRHRLRDAFVVVQVAVSLLLVATAGLLSRSLVNALSSYPGFTVEHGVALSIDLTMHGFTPAKRDAFLARLLQRTATLPGVQSASVGSMPLSGQSSGDRLAIEGVHTESDESVTILGAWPEYFRALGTPIVRGREFVATDNGSSAPVVIVNERFARRYLGDADPIGKRVRIGGASQPLREVVGVARDGKYFYLTESGYPVAFLPEQQYSRAGDAGLSLIVRTAGSADAMIPALVNALREQQANPAYYQARTFEQVVAAGAGPLRLQTATVTVMGALALGLAVLGLYAVLAHAVSARTREIGVRVALGAQRHHVLVMFVREGLLLCAVGSVVGLALSIASARVVGGFLYGVTPTDPVTLLVATAVLALAASMASYLPARRATAVQPIVALRHE